MERQQQQQQRQQQQQQQRQQQQQQRRHQQREQQRELQRQEQREQEREQEREQQREQQRQQQQEREKQWQQLQRHRREASSPPLQLHYHDPQLDHRHHPQDHLMEDATGNLKIAFADDDDGMFSSTTAADQFYSSSSSQVSGLEASSPHQQIIDHTQPFDMAPDQVPAFKKKRVSDGKLFSFSVTTNESLSHM